MNLIFSMLLSSNSLLLLFIVIEHFMGDAFSQKNKYLILKVALFFSILPLGSVKTLIFTVINYYFPTVNMMDLSISGKIQTFVVTPVGFSINTTYRNNLIILLVWFSISVIMFIVCLRKQYIFRQRPKYYTEVYCSRNVKSAKKAYAASKHKQEHTNICN